MISEDVNIHFYALSCCRLFYKTDRRFFKPELTVAAVRK